MANIAEATEEEFENNNGKAAQICQCLSDLSKDAILVMERVGEPIAFFSEQTLWVDAQEIELIRGNSQ
tara:strand:+ start:432 stop:635 length:204 start_codon:yes stop_codon:yes gene_type:complete